MKRVLFWILIAVLFASTAKAERYIPPHKQYKITTNPSPILVVPGVGYRTWGPRISRSCPVPSPIPRPEPAPYAGYYNPHYVPRTPANPTFIINPYAKLNQEHWKKYGTK